MFNIDDMHWTVEMTSNRIIDNNGLIFCSHYVDRFISAIFKSIIHKFGKIHIFCDAKCLLAIVILWLASLHIHRSIKLYRLVKGKVYDIFHGSMNSHLCKSTFFCSVVQTKENNQIWQEWHISTFPRKQRKPFWLLLHNAHILLIFSSNISNVTSPLLWKEQG